MVASQSSANKNDAYAKTLGAWVFHKKCEDGCRCKQGNIRDAQGGYIPLTNEQISIEKTLAQLTQQLIRAVEDATIDEGLIEKSYQSKKTEQENINRLRDEIARVAAQEHVEACKQKIKNIADQGSKDFQDTLNKVRQEMNDKLDKIIASIEAKSFL